MNKRKKEFYDFMICLSIRCLTGMAILVWIVVALIVLRGNERLKETEISLGIIQKQEYSIEIEYIPMEERMSRYIDTLPIPEREVLEVNEEVIEEEIEEEIVNISFNYDNELSKRVEGMNPKIRNLNTSSYCACEECCGKTDGITASGELATAWYTVAAGKSYKMGTIIYIPALSDKPNQGWFVVEDRGGAISDDKLDIYLNTHSEALQYGRKTWECYIYEF